MREIVVLFLLVLSLLLFFQPLVALSLSEKMFLQCILQLGHTCITASKEQALSYAHHFIDRRSFCHTSQTFCLIYAALVHIMGGAQGKG